MCPHNFQMGLSSFTIQEMEVLDTKLQDEKAASSTVSIFISSVLYFFCLQDLAPNLIYSDVSNIFVCGFLCFTEFSYIPKVAR